MSIPNTTNEVSYMSDGRTNAIFPIPFGFRSSEPINVYYYTDPASTQDAVLNTDYTLVIQNSTGSTDPVTDSVPGEYGYIKWIGASPNKKTVVIQRKETAKQPLDIMTGGGKRIDPDNATFALDRIISSNQGAMSLDKSGKPAYSAQGKNIIMYEGKYAQDTVTKGQVDEQEGYSQRPWDNTHHPGKFWSVIDASTPTQGWDTKNQLATYSANNPDHALLYNNAWIDEPRIPKLPAGIPRGCARATIDAGAGIKNVGMASPRELPYNTEGGSRDILEVTGTNQYKWRSFRESPLAGGGVNKMLYHSPGSGALAWDTEWKYGIYTVTGVTQAEDHTNDDSAYLGYLYHRANCHPASSSGAYEIPHGLGATPNFVLFMVQSPKITTFLHPNYNKYPTFLISGKKGAPGYADATNLYPRLTMLNRETAFNDDVAGRGCIYWTGNHPVKIHWFARL